MKTIEDSFGFLAPRDINNSIHLVKGSSSFFFFRVKIRCLYERVILTELLTYMEDLNMKTLFTFVLGVVCGIVFSIGVLMGSGHMNTNLKQVNYVVETTQFDGFSFR